MIVGEGSFPLCDCRAISVALDFNFFEIFLFLISSSPNYIFFLKFFIFIFLEVDIVLDTFLAYFKGVNLDFLFKVKELFILV